MRIETEKKKKKAAAAARLQTATHSTALTGTAPSSSLSGLSILQIPQPETPPSSPPWGLPIPVQCPRSHTCRVNE